VSHFRPKEVLHRAQELEKDGQKGEAANQYALLSFYLRKKKRWSDALKMVEKASALRPDSGRLNLEKALVLWGLEQPGDALQLIDLAVQVGLEKKQLEVYLKLLQKDSNAAPGVIKKFIESWIAIDRTSPVPFLGLAEFSEKEENWQEAKKLYLSALRIASQEEVVKKLRKVLEHLSLPQEISALEKYQKGTLDLDRLVLLLGGKPPSQADSLPETVAPVSDSVYELKDLGELVSELEKELELDTEENFENVEPLIQEFRRKSNQVIGSDLQARLDLASAFFEMGRLKEAKAELALVDSDHLLFSQAQHLLGIILMKEGSDVAALGAFQSALRNAVTGTVFWKETVYQLIKLHLKLKDYPTASALVHKLEQADEQYRDLRALKDQLKNRAKS